MKKIYLSLLSVGLLTIGLLNAQNVGYPVEMKGGEHELVNTGSRAAGTCLEFRYYNPDDVSSIIGAGSEVMIYVDPDEWAFYHDTSWISSVSARILDTLNGFDTYDSVYLEIYEGSTISGVGFSDQMTLGNLIYSKNVTNDVLTWSNFSISTFTLDSMIKINTDTAYTISFRMENYQRNAMYIEDETPRTGKGDWVRTSGGDIVRSGSNWVIEFCIDGSEITPANNISVGIPFSTLNSYEVLATNQIITKGMYFGADVTNNGLNGASNVSMNINIQPENVDESVDVGALSVGATSLANFPTAFIPIQEGLHYAEVTASMDSTDAYLSDNSRFLREFYVYASKYGRAARAQVNTNGWSTSYEDIYQGNVMDIYEPDTLKYIEAHLLSPQDGAEFYGFCIGWDSANMEVFGDTLRTDTFLVGPDISTDGDTVITLSFQNHTNLDAGKYLFGIVELSGEAWSGMGSNTRNYVDGTAFYTLSVNGNNVGSWFDAGYYYPVVMSFANTYNPGFKEKSENLFKVYPNPANDVLNVRFDGSFEATSVQVLDLLGNVVLSQNSYGRKYVKLNTASLAKGVYIVKANNENIEQVKKVVIK